MNKEAKLKLGLTVGGIAAAGLIVAPFVFTAIGGMIGLAVAGAVGFVLVNLTPWFAQKVTNWKYNLNESERINQIKKVEKKAEENPIETMRVLLLDKAKAFGTFQATVENAVTAREAFAKKCESFSRKYPARAAEFNKQLTNITMMVEAKKNALSEAKQSLDEAAHKFEEMKAYWDMSQAAQQANQAAGMDTGDMYERLKADTACEAVFESVNRAFAQLEVAATLSESDALSYNPSEVIDVVATKQKALA